MNNDMHTIEVLSGAIRWRTSMGDDGAVYEAGDTLVFDVGAPTIGDTMQDSPLRRAAEEDVAAPSVGTASTFGNMRPGEFKVTAGGTPLTVRLYDGGAFKETMLPAGGSLSLATIETNAVTAAFYP